MRKSIVDGLRELLLYLATLPDYRDCLRQTLNAAVFAVARSTGQTPRVVAEELLLNVPSDIEWRDKLLPAFEERDPHTTANLHRAARTLSIPIPPDATLN